MKTEDLKNYIFEQYLSEAKMHPLVMRGAQWVADNIGGDAKKLAGKMTRGINRTTNEPTPEHVYNAAQFHFGEILRKNSPSMDRPEIYADMRTRLRAHLGMESEVNETSDVLKQKLEDGRREQAMKAYDTSNDIFKEWEKIYKRTGKIDQNLDTVRKFMGDKATTLMASVKKVRNRRIGLKGDGSPRTPTQESAFNFINGLKELTENSRRRKDANNSAQQKRYGWTHKDTRVQDYADKMYPEPDDVSEFENEQLQGRRNEAELALRRREDPYNIKRNIRDMLFRIKK